VLREQFVSESSRIGNLNFQFNKTGKRRAGGVAQLVQHLPGKHEILISNHVQEKEREREMDQVAQACNLSYLGGGDWED
jgi:hypothetical protein